MFDHFDSIGEDKLTAERILKQALKEGVKLGRLRLSRKRRGRQREMFKLVTKAEMMKVVDKWKKNKESVEFVSDRISSKKRASKVNAKVLKVGGGTTIVKYIPKNINELDADVQVLEENLTPKTWAKQRSLKMKQMQSPKIKQIPKPVVAFDLSQSLIPQHPNSFFFF